MTDQVDEQTEPIAPSAEPDDVQSDRDAQAPTDDGQSVQQELHAAREQAQENESKYLRARADMDNYRKRIERTYAENLKASKKELLKKLLTVKDNLERAVHYGEQGEQGTGESLMEGVRLTLYQLDNLLEQEGVKPIEVVGEPFNPHLEEAVQRVDDPNVPDQTVIQEARKGYMYGDEVLRPAQVIVSVHEPNQ